MTTTLERPEKKRVRSVIYYQIPTVPWEIGENRSSKWRKNSSGTYILGVSPVTFLYLSHKPPLRCWTWLYHQKSNKTTFPTISCPCGNRVNFLHTSQMHFSANNTSFCPFKPMGLSAHRHADRHTNTQKWKQYILGGYKKNISRTPPAGQVYCFS